MPSLFEPKLKLNYKELRQQSFIYSYFIIKFPSIVVLNSYHSLLKFK